MNSKKMRAVVCTKYGSPEVLQLKEVEKPTPKDNEVLIKINSTTVTAGDTRMRSFNVPISFWLPARIVLGFRKPKKEIPGMELAGVIEKVGKDVTKYKSGDQVFAWITDNGFGGYAEYKCLPEDCLMAIKSDKVSFEDVVALPVGGRTALYFLQQANIQTGQKVLIYGASGSVGTYAVQLAKHFGANVSAVCSTTNLELVKSLGADKVIDYTNEEFTKNGEVYDVIFDTVGKYPFSTALKVLKKNGFFLHSVASPGMSIRMKFTSLITGKNMVGGGPRGGFAKSEDLVYLQELVESKKIKTVIDKIYPLEQIVEAHRYVDSGRKKGNVVIKI